MAVECTSTKLSARLRDGAVFFDKAPLRKKVSPETLEWELAEDDGGLALVVTVEKLDRTFMAAEHWERLVAGHPPVDTQAIPVALSQEFED